MKSHCIFEISAKIPKIFPTIFFCSIIFLAKITVHIICFPRSKFPTSSILLHTTGFRLNSKHLVEKLGFRRGQGQSKIKMVEYEEQRLKRIEENKRKMEELNLKPLAYETMDLMKGKKQKTKKMKSKQIVANNDEYLPNQEEEQSTEEDDIEKVQTSLRSYSKKVMATGRGNLEKRTEKPQVCTCLMASLMKTCSQIHKILLQQREDKNQHDVNLLTMNQQGFTTVRKKCILNKTEGYLYKPCRSAM